MAQLQRRDEFAREQGAQGADAFAQHDAHEQKKGGIFAKLKNKAKQVKQKIGGHSETPKAQVEDATGQKQPQQPNCFGLLDSDKMSSSSSSSSSDNEESSDGGKGDYLASGQAEHPLQSTQIADSDLAKNAFDLAKGNTTTGVGGGPEGNLGGPPVIAGPASEAAGKIARSEIPPASSSPAGVLHDVPPEALETNAGKLDLQGNQANLSQQADTPHVGQGYSAAGQFVPEESEKALTAGDASTALTAGDASTSVTRGIGESASSLPQERKHKFREAVKYAGDLALAGSVLAIVGVGSAIGAFSRESKDKIEQKADELSANADRLAKEDEGVPVQEPAEARVKAEPGMDAQTTAQHLYNKTTENVEVLQESAAKTLGYRQEGSGIASEAAVQPGQVKDDDKEGVDSASKVKDNVVGAVAGGAGAVGAALGLNKATSSSSSSSSSSSESDAEQNSKQRLSGQDDLHMSDGKSEVHPQKEGKNYFQQLADTITGNKKNEYGSVAAEVNEEDGAKLLAKEHAEKPKSLQEEINDLVGTPAKQANASAERETQAIGSGLSSDQPEETANTNPHAYTPEAMDIGQAKPTLTQRAADTGSYLKDSAVSVVGLGRTSATGEGERTAADYKNELQETEVGSLKQPEQESANAENKPPTLTQRLANSAAFVVGRGGGYTAEKSPVTEEVQQTEGEKTQLNEPQAAEEGSTPPTLTERLKTSLLGQPPATDGGQQTESEKTQLKEPEAAEEGSIPPTLTERLKTSLLGQPPATDGGQQTESEKTQLKEPQAAEEGSIPPTLTERLKTSLLGQTPATDGGQQTESEEPMNQTQQPTEESSKPPTLTERLKTSLIGTSNKNISTTDAGEEAPSLEGESGAPLTEGQRQEIGVDEKKSVVQQAKDSATAILGRGNASTPAEAPGGLQQGSVPPATNESQHAAEPQGNRNVENVESQGVDRNASPRHGVLGLVSSIFGVKN